MTEWLKLLRHKEEQKVRFKFLAKVSGWIVVLLGGKGGQVQKKSSEDEHRNESGCLCH